MDITAEALLEWVRAGGEMTMGSAVDADGSTGTRDPLRECERDCDLGEGMMTSAMKLVPESSGIGSVRSCVFGDVDFERPGTTDGIDAGHELGG